MKGSAVRVRPSASAPFGKRPASGAFLRSSGVIAGCHGWTREDACGPQMRNACGIASAASDQAFNGRGVRPIRRHHRCRPCVSGDSVGDDEECPSGRRRLAAREDLRRHGDEGHALGQLHDLVGPNEEVGASSSSPIAPRRQSKWGDPNAFNAAASACTVGATQLSATARAKPLGGEVPAPRLTAAGATRCRAEAPQFT